MLTLSTATPSEKLRQLVSRPGVPLLVLGAALVAFALRSETLSSGDAMLHVYIARDAWSRPELFFDVWGRPVFTLLYAAPAWLGLWAVRLTSVAVALLTCYATYRLAQAVGARRAFLVVPLLALQPFFTQCAFDGLTELPFACLIVCALWAFHRERWLTCALLASMLSMARWEGILLMALWSPLLARRRWWLPIVVFAPHVAWNGLNAVTFGDPLAWLFPLDMLWRDPTFTPKSHEMRRLLFYAGGFSTIVGPSLFFLTQLGFLARTWKRGIVATSLIALAAFYVVAAWRMPGVRGAAVPMYRYFAGIAPLIALCAVDGLDALLDGDRWLRRRAVVAGVVIFEFVGWWFVSKDLPWHARVHFFSVTAVALAVVMRPPTQAWARRALVAFVIASMLVHAGRFVRPFTSNGTLASLATRVADYIHKEAPDGGVVLFSEPFLGTALVDGAPANVRYQLTWMNVPRVLALPVGDWVVWDSINSAQYFFRVPRSLLDEHPGYSFVTRFERDNVEIRLYRRVRGASDDEADFRRFTKPYWPDNKGSGMTGAIMSGVH